MSKAEGGANKKRRGLSLDDKRKLLLNLYHERAEPFNLKELEVAGTKAGVVTQTIKEVNQSLVDDSLVQQDKIGTINIFWSFPLKAVQDQIAERDRLTVEKAYQQKLIHEYEEKIKEAKSVRSAKDRKEKLAQLANLLEREKQVDKQLEEMKVNDPELVHTIEQQTNTAIQAVNRWTDNIYSIRSFLVKKKGIPSKEANQFLKINADFDYV